MPESGSLAPPTPSTGPLSSGHDSPSGQPSCAPLKPGTVVAGHQIVSFRGEGAMGMVYEAMDPEGNRVALKLLKPEKAADEAIIQDFRNEAEATGAVDHENVVTVLDQGFADGFHFIRMEYVSGPPLHVYLEEKKLLPWREATTIVVQVARALACAHHLGLIHRDVKPENILLYPDGRARLTDFGIVKDISSLKGFLLKGEQVGTAAYAAPEQILGKRLDASTDMYSLGATFYHMVCGRHPFRGKSLNEVMNKHVKAQLIPPISVVADMPKPLSNAIEKMMAKRQIDRYPTMDRLIDDLELLLEGKVAIADAKPRVDPTTMAPLRSMQRAKGERRRRSRVPAEAILVAVLAAVALVIFVLMLVR